MEQYSEILRLLARYATPLSYISSTFVGPVASGCRLLVRIGGSSGTSSINSLPHYKKKLETSYNDQSGSLSIRLALFPNLKHWFRQLHYSKSLRSATVLLFSYSFLAINTMILVHSFRRGNIARAAFHDSFESLPHFFSNSAPDNKPLKIRVEGGQQSSSRKNMPCLT